MPIKDIRPERALRPPKLDRLAYAPPLDYSLSAASERYGSTSPKSLRGSSAIFNQVELDHDPSATRVFFLPRDIEDSKRASACIIPAPPGDRQENLRKERLYALFVSFMVLGQGLAA